MIYLAMSVEADQCHRQADGERAARVVSHAHSGRGQLTGSGSRDLGRSVWLLISGHL